MLEKAAFVAAVIYVRFIFLKVPQLQPGYQLIFKAK